MTLFLILLAAVATGQPIAPQAPTVRDRLWVWAHDAGVYDGSWGLPGPSRMTPVEGAAYLGLKNIIFIRYLGKPAPPFDQFFIPFRSMNHVMWSITGANGITSMDERAAVFRLAAANPNISGVFMDDFFHLAADAPAGAPQWLAKNEPSFPVELNVELPQARTLTRVDLQQTEWRTGDYRSKDVAVATSIDGVRWVEAGGGRLPNEAGVVHPVALSGDPVRFLRVRFLNTYDAGTKSSQSCGLRGLKLWSDATAIDLKNSRIEASSSFPGHEPSLLIDPSTATAPAALSVSALRSIRQSLQLSDRRLDLGVTLYTYQLTPRVQAHLELCDIVSLWTWKSEDLAALETNFVRLRELAPHKRLLLGCYLYDFGNNRALPLDRMKHQCRLALRWLEEDKIEGIIFLGTNVCDFNLEAVEWTRAWIAQVGSKSLANRP